MCVCVMCCGVLHSLNTIFSCFLTQSPGFHVIFSPMSWCVFFSLLCWIWLLIFLHSHPPAHSLFSVNPRVSFSVARGQPQPLGFSELHWARSRKRVRRREQHSDPRHPLPVHTRLLCTSSHRPAVCQGNSTNAVSTLSTETDFVM